MKKWKRELRDVLLGKTVANGEGMLCTPEAGTFRLPMGVGDGAASVRLFGLRGRGRACESALAQEETLARVRARMREIGRAVYLREQPDAAACLIRYILTRPALLVFRYTGDGPVLTAWTGGGVTSWISRVRAFRTFGRELPEGLEITDRKVRQETKEKKPRRARAPSEDPAAREAAPAQEKNEAPEEAPETGRRTEDRET